MLTLFLAACVYQLLEGRCVRIQAGSWLEQTLVCCGVLQGSRVNESLALMISITQIGTLTHVWYIIICRDGVLVTVTDCAPVPSNKICNSQKIVLESRCNSYPVDVYLLISKHQTDLEQWPLISVVTPYFVPDTQIWYLKTQTDEHTDSCVDVV